MGYSNALLWVGERERVIRTLVRAGTTYPYLSAAQIAKISISRQVMSDMQQDKVNSLILQKNRF
jgi:hypothetical protein